MIKQVAAAITVVALTASCASIFNGTTDTLSINSRTPGAEIYVNNQLLGTDSVTYVARKKENHVIRVEKEGCTPQTQAVPKTFDGTTLLGLLIDAGLFSILLIDFGINGATSKAAQTNFTLNLTCDA